MNGFRIPAAAVAALVFAAGVTAPARNAAAAAPLLDLSKPPLFLNAAVDPNMMVTFDDSGSMADGFVPDSVGAGSCIWRHNRYYSSVFNKQYYDPSITYSPPLDSTGAEYPNSSFAAASTNGFNASAPKINLGTAYFASFSESSTPDRISYQAGATSTSGCDASNKTFEFPGKVARAFYCTLKLPTGDINKDGDFNCTAVGAAEQTNFANWFTYYRYRSNTLKSAITRSFGLLDDDIRVGWQNMNNNAITSTTTIGKFNGTRRTGFFNFITSSPASGNTPTLDSVIRVNNFFARAKKADETDPYYDLTAGKELSCRQNFHVLVTDGYWNQNPNHPGTASKASVINRSLPDGKLFNTADPYSRIIWNESARQFNCATVKDSSKPPKLIGECSPSYTDLAFDSWGRDLRSDLEDNVPTYFPDRTTGVTGPKVVVDKDKDPRTYPELYWNPANDPATWQHVVQFFIGFGISGSVPYSDASLTDLRTGKIKWPGAGNNVPESVDDSWHASLASRGKYFGATDPNQIVDALTDILSSIVQRKGSASALSVSTGIVTGDTLTYQTQFDSTDWSGDVVARPIGLDFSVTAPKWSAADKLPAWNARQILTAKASGAAVGVPFRWGSLSSAQQALLDKNPSGGKTDGLGSLRVEYLRGDKSKERANTGGAFRNRSSVFGAVVSSVAAYVGPPRQHYELTLDKKYADFAKLNQNRAGMVAVGANDGMLHVLDAKDGTEYFAYVPYAVYKNLNKLTDPIYNFEPTVDNTPVTADVYIKGAWRTVLIGTLRRGGQGVFALDITDPNVTEANASSKVLWDLTDATLPDLGYTYGTPYVTHLSNGKWVALVPAGYNSQEADGSVGAGNAALFVIDIETGSLLKEIDLTKLDPNARGLAAPVAVDLDSDDTAELAYAGDLAGNIWRFNLVGNPSAWDATLLFQPAKPFERPITVQPRVLRDIDSGLPFVYVGTGKFIETTDRTSSIPVQAFYGIRDDGSVVTPAKLTARSVVTTGDMRRVDPTSSAVPAGAQGWMIEFNEAAYKGERVISPAGLRITANEVLFSTLVPTNDDPCKPGGSSFVMFVDGAGGGSSPDGLAYFDTNKDKIVDRNDDASVVGKKIQTLVAGIASLVSQGGGTGAVLIPGEDGKVDSLTTREFEWRRRGWRQMFMQNQ